MTGPKLSGGSRIRSEQEAFSKSVPAQRHLEDQRTKGDQILIIHSKSGNVCGFFHPANPTFGMNDSDRHNHYHQQCYHYLHYHHLKVSGRI